MYITLIIGIFFIPPETPHPAENILQESSRITVSSAAADSQKSSFRELLSSVEQGIRTGRVDEFSGSLAAIVAVSIGSGERGYFSMNQVSGMIANYLLLRRPVSFEFSRIHERGAAPYATGRFVFLRKGIEESAQIYISLIRQDGRWLINQFNIY